MNVPRLVGVHAKLERAKQHVRDLQARIMDFVQANQYLIGREIDPQTGDLLFKLQHRPKIPADFAVIAGDALHNIRTALDHLAWQLVEAAGATPTNRTCFPICDSLDKYEARDKTKQEGIGQDAMHLIDATEPYQGGNDDLWVIHHLNNIDKHRLLIPMATVNRNIILNADRQLLALRPKTAVPLEDGAEILRVSPYVTRGSEMDMKAQFTFLITFGEPQVLQGKALSPTLHHLADVVNGIVDQFVPFL